LKESKNYNNKKSRSEELDLTNDIDAASQLLERIDSKQLELKKFKEDLRNFEDAILKKENS